MRFTANQIVASAPVFSSSNFAIKLIIILSAVLAWCERGKGVALEGACLLRTDAHDDW